MKNILKLSAFFAVCAMLVIGLAACGDDDGDILSGTITGTITIDAYDGSTDNKPYVVIVDDDDDPGNGYTAHTGGTYPAGDSQQTFTLQNVPAGTYYVLAVIYVTGTEGPPKENDFFGAKDGIFNPVNDCSYFPPAATVVVISATQAQADITVNRQGASCI
jgi:predicted small lipoprotein YifL